jgi:hypothetical protein
LCTWACKKVTGDLLFFRVLLHFCMKKIIFAWRYADLQPPTMKLTLFSSSIRILMYFTLNCKKKKNVFYSENEFDRICKKNHLNFKEFWLKIYQLLFCRINLNVPKNFRWITNSFSLLSQPFARISSVTIFTT